MSNADGNDGNGKAVWAQAGDRLRGLDSAHRLRTDELCDVPETDTGAFRTIDGKALINFCSNDYLDLAQHPAVKQGAVDAINQYGAGCMASRLICGTLPIHRELEDAITRFKGTESALVFSSGYMACLGAIQTLGLRADDSLVPIIFDRLAHASLIDAATQNRRNWRSFPHNDVPSLEILLKGLTGKSWPAAIVVTEGIFSMDGDMAPLKVISELCVKYKALLLIDDAHGTGVLGENGEGAAHQAGISGEPHVVQVGTLSKAVGGQGGFVTGSTILRELLVNMARSFIFDTGLNPGSVGAALAAFKIMAEEPDRRKALHENTLLFRSQLNRIGCDRENPSPIIPLVLRGEEEALAASAGLREKGFLVAAIRPPTVPPGTSRLRITINSAHKETDIRRLAKALSQMETT